MSNSIGDIPQAMSTSTSKLKDNIDSKSATFSEVFQDIIDRKHKSGMKGISFLSTLDPYELSVIQKSKRIADPLSPDRISVEGAENLFVLHGDNDRYVDLNNDDLTEIGEGKILIFPPPNCSSQVKAAWARLCQSISFEEKMLVEGRFLAEDLVRRCSGKNATIYGNSDRDFTVLIDRIQQHARDFDMLLSNEQQEQNKWIICILDRFKSEIAKGLST